jgi:hypothetical protein
MNGKSETDHVSNPRECKPSASRTMKSTIGCSGLLAVSEQMVEKTQIANRENVRERELLTFAIGGSVVSTSARAVRRRMRGHISHRSPETQFKDG